MNMPLMKRNPDTVIAVNSYINGLIIAMNDYLKYTKIEFKKGQTFTDHEDYKNNEFLKSAIEFNQTSSDTVPEEVLFSCKSNKKTSFLGQF